jgi:preprotein translocase subunit SecE
MSAGNKTTVLGYFREAKQELEKVSWPSQKEIISYSIIVIIATIIVAAYFGAADWVLQKALAWIVGIAN